MMARWAIATVAALGLAACATAPTEEAGVYRPIGLLAIGDAGYAYDYITPRSAERAPRTEAGFVAQERERWIQRPPAAGGVRGVADYQLPNGGYVRSERDDARIKCRTPILQSAACDAGVVLGDNIYPDYAHAGADGHGDAQRFADIFEAALRLDALARRGIPPVRCARQSRLAHLARRRDGASRLPRTTLLRSTWMA